MDIYKEIKEKLIELSEEDYKKFNSKLCPDTNKEILGIRIPKLRKLAKDIVKGENWKEFLNNHEEKYFEEVLLEGLLIAYSEEKLEDKFVYMREFIPKMDSWEMTDTFTPTLKIKEQELELYWNFIMPYTKSTREFEIRYAIISILDYFIKEEYIDKIIDILDNINNDGYYVKMAVAWTLAEIGVKFNERLIDYLKGNNNLDKFTFNKTLQKMIESYRISNEQKIILKSMKKNNIV